MWTHEYRRFVYTAMKDSNVLPSTLIVGEHKIKPTGLRVEFKKFSDQPWQVHHVQVLDINRASPQSFTIDPASHQWVNDLIEKVHPESDEGHSSLQDTAMALQKVRDEFGG